MTKSAPCGRGRVLGGAGGWGGGGGWGHDRMGGSMGVDNVYQQYVTKFAGHLYFRVSSTK